MDDNTSAMTIRHETLAWRRVRTAQDLAADGITRVAGSMTFVYLHVAWFAARSSCRPS